MSQKENIASTIRSIRTKLNITQNELANRLGVSFATVNRWEGGSNEPQQAQLDAILALNAEVVANDELAKSEEQVLEECFLAGQKNSELTVDEKIKLLAQECLGSFSVIARRAREYLKSAPSRREATQIANNTFTNGSADQKFQSVRADLKAGYEGIAAEPALARVVVERKNGTRDTYYFSRNNSLDCSPPYLRFTSLKAPVGRMASIPVGDEYDLPSGQTVTILENARFSPKIENREWDTHRAEIRGEGYARTVKSLRAFLRQAAGDEEITDQNLLEALLNEGNASENIKNGIRRVTIERMDLRDQPVLDEYQDKIFRLPLDTLIFCWGAPVRANTTTLILRLNQKIDPNFLDDDEKRLLSLTNAETGHASNWVMFTPTELLKLVIKEACSREKIPASDNQVKTWADFREELARDNFPILKSGANKGRFVMKDAAATLARAAEEDLIGLFSDFDQWQKAEFWKELQVDAERLMENHASEVVDIGRKILSAIKDVDDKSVPSTFSSLAALTGKIKEAADTRKKETDKKFQETLNLQVNRNRSFLDELSVFMDSLSESDDDPDEEDADTEEEIETPRTKRHAAMARYIAVSRTHARTRAQGKQVPKASSTGRIIEWLGDRIISEDVAKDVGKSLIVQSALRRFVNPVRGYIDKIPTRYRRYRRAKQEDGRLYRGDGFAPTDIHPLEVDIILLAMLRNTDDLIVGIRTPDDEARKTLDRLQNLYYTQVLVDEATDFSPIQLACMAALSRPRIRSFFACGDFNQRFTNYGVRSIDQVKWAVPSIADERISITYRHSNHLHRLAQSIIGLSGEGVAEVHISEEYADNEGVAPVLALNLDNREAQAAWLAARIQEIEKSLGKLPSVAVLVNDEESVRSVAEALKRALEDQNIQVIPCADGQVRGRDSAVRVFNVQHIKGLEFEAVFFVDLDKLVESQPDLFEKYLYVGATRAATYFGITCEKEFPQKLEQISGLFGDTWS